MDEHTTQMDASHQTRAIDSVLGQWWSSFPDAYPTLYQHALNPQIVSVILRMRHLQYTYAILQTCNSAYVDNRQCTLNAVSVILRMCHI